VIEVQVEKSTLGLGFRNLEMAFAILLSLTICGCNSLRLLKKERRGTSVALNRVLESNTMLIYDLKVCLVSKAASINDLKKKEMDIFAVSVFDVENSAIVETHLTRENDDTQSRLAIENCRKSATEKASAYFRERVLKHDEMLSEFKGYKGKFYMDGTLMPALAIVISDEPKEVENRAIFASAKDSK
jgi:hypothetical protein